MIRKITATAVLALATLAAPLLLAAPAGAQQYPGCQAVFSDTTPAPGQIVTVTGNGAGAGDVVTATLLGTVIGSGTADANGAFAFNATIPANLAAGTYLVTINCGPTGGVLGVTIVVGATVTPPLPRTGSNDTIPLTRLGIALIAAGALVLAASRRRSSKRERFTTA